MEPLRPVRLHQTPVQHLLLRRGALHPPNPHRAPAQPPKRDAADPARHGGKLHPLLARLARRHVREHHFCHSGRADGLSGMEPGRGEGLWGAEAGLVCVRGDKAGQETQQHGDVAREWPDDEAADGHNHGNR